MNLLSFLDFFNPTGLNNTLFYPLLIISVSYIAAVLLLFIDPKNRYLYLLRSIPKIVIITCICVNGLWRLKEVVDSLFVFQMFVLGIIMLTLGGMITEFKLKYMLATHSISILLHGCFYFYCKHYDAGVISGAFHPTFEYLVFLVLVNFCICHLTLPDHIKIVSVKIPFIDSFMPVNEKNSYKKIVLLLAYSMIIHSTFMVFIYNCTFSGYWILIFVCFAVFLQLIFVILCLRIMHIYPSSANVPFYVSAYFMIIKTLMDSVSTNIESYIQNKPFNVQYQYFSNKLLYLFVYILAIFILSCEVAIAVDEIEEPQPSSPVSESNVFNRISQSGASKLFFYAG